MQLTSSDVRLLSRECLRPGALYREDVRPLSRRGFGFECTAAAFREANVPH